MFTRAALRGLLVMAFLSSSILPTARASSINPSSFHTTIAKGQTVTVPREVTLDGLGPAASRIDVYFLADNTGSMGGAIGNVRNNAQFILDAISGGDPRFQDIDIAYGVAAYFGDPREYGGNNASKISRALKLLQPVTESKDDVQAAIDKWIASGGGDSPEANFFALQQLATNGAATDGVGSTDLGFASGYQFGWREDSIKLIIWFGDVQSHTTTVDLNEVITALNDNRVIVAAINTRNTNSGIDTRSEASAIVNATHGLIAHNVTGKDATVEAILNAVEHATEFVDLDLKARNVPADISVKFSCASANGCTDVSIGESRVFDMTVTGDIEGEYDFESYVPFLASTTSADLITVRSCVTELSARGSRSKISVTWTDTGADHYVVYRSLSETGPFEAIASTTSRYSTYGDRDVAAGTTYYYQVKEADASGVEYCESLVASTTTASRFRPEPPNLPPLIQSAPVTAAIEDELYEYAISATDPESQPLSFELSFAPMGMTIDAAGVVRWTPANHHVGNHNIIITVADNEGLSTTQSYTLSVENTNDAPEFDSTPITHISVGQQYTYAAHAFDVDAGDSVTYSLVSGPATMTLDPASGLLQWLPQFGDGPDQTVTLRATDEQGTFDEQTYVITVEEPNRAPSITSIPVTTAVTLAEYSYAVTADDPDAGDTKEFSLLVYPENMEIDANSGLITWTPDRTQVGDFDVSVQVIDAGDLSDIQNFVLTVTRDNTAPQIQSVPLLDATIGVEYSYQATAIDAEDDPLIWSLPVAPAGMAVDPTGLVTWTPDAGQLGLQAVELAADDGFGGTTTQQFEITVVAPPNLSPAITSSSVTEAVRDLAYSYQVIASDPENDPLSYALTTAPAGMSITPAGLVSWMPTLGDVGDHPIQIQVNDASNVVTQNYVLTVLAAPAGNQAPNITSSPEASVLEADEFTYAIIATDPEGDSISYSLISGPAGAGISGNLLSWTTSPADVNVHALTIRAEDQWGAYQEQSFDLTVTANQAPSITSTPAAEITEGNLFLYQIAATDPEARTLTYNLLAGPTGASLNSSGLLQWQSQVGDAGSVDFNLEVSDHLGGAVQQSFTLLVSSVPVNTPPQILSSPDTAATVGQLYEYDVNALDGDGDTLSYQLTASPSGMTINATNGLISWTPTVAQTGNHDVVISVTDGQGGEATQSFAVTVPVPVNNPPEITSTPSSLANIGTEYLYQVTASDPEGNPLVFSLSQSPAGMQINAVSGLIDWTPVAGQTGSHDITLEVSDGANIVEQSFTVTVQDIADLSVSIVLSDNIVAPDEVVTIQVAAPDAINPVYNLMINGQPLALDAGGTGTFSSTTSGIYLLEAQVQSSNGAIGSAQADLRISVPADITPPVATLNTPVDGDEVFELTDVIGTVTDTNLYRYRLLLAEAGSGDFVEFAAANAPVSNDILASLDPSMLTNGLYTLLLVAEDLNGLESQDSVDVRIEGQLKPGVVQLSFVDMTVPVAGIPIVIERTYDSRVKSQRDLGVGWNLSVRQGEYENNRDPGKGWGVASSGGFFKIPCYTSVEQAYHTTDIRLSETESYQFRPRINLSGYGSVISGGCLGQAEFLQVSGPGGAVLQPLGNNNVFYLNGTDVFTYDLGDDRFGEPWVPENVRLTTPDGRVFDLNITSGISRLQNANGNQLFISSNGVVNSAGQGVVFSRDGNGRIASIQDPLGNVVQYSYDADNNLAGFTNQLSQETTYQYYDAPFLNHLKSITLPDGSELSSFEYNADGRLSQVCDPDGCASADYDLAGRTQTNIDATGRAITYVYDEKGNVISQSDALGNTHLFSYDADGNLLEHTDPEGNITTRTWDANGNVLTYTEPHGPSEDPADFTTTYTYDARGNTLTVTSPNGAQVVNTYDSTGNRLSMATESGFIISQFSYDSNGRQISESGPFGSMDFAYNSGGMLNSLTDDQGTTTTLVHDAAGKVTSYTHDGVTGTIDYDAMGRETSYSYSDGLSFEYEYGFGDSWTSIEGSTIPAMERSLTAKGAPDSITQVDGSGVSWEYDAAGRVTAEVDALGGRHSYQYDAAGRLIQETNPLGEVVSYELDGNGRKLAVINAEGGRSEYSYYPNGRQQTMTDASGRSWSYAYTPLSATSVDDLGRSVTTETSPQGLITRIVNADGSQRSWTYLVPTESLDGADLPTSFIDEAGRVRNFTYDGSGRLQTASDLAGEVATYGYGPDGLSTVTDAEGESIGFSYDDFGDVTALTFADGSGKSLTYNGNRNLASVTLASGATKTLSYDALNRLTQDSRSTGESFSYSWDANGNLLTATDALGTAVYDYDAAGNLELMGSSTGEAIQYQYDGVGRVTAQTVINSDGSQSKTIEYDYDAAGRLIGITDPNAGETSLTYDPAGRLISRTLPNAITTNYEYDLRDQITAVIHSNGSGTVISSVHYDRNIGGEPGRITWLDDSYVELSYDTALRVVEERFFDATDTLVRSIAYDYDLVGNRTARIQNGSTTNYSYGAGHRLLSTSGGEIQNYTYNSDGRVAGITRSGLDADLSYNFDGQLSTADLGSSTISYVYDAAGRRIQASDGSTIRRFLKAPAVLGAYENPQAIEDADSNLLQTYVYAGDQPLQRIEGSSTYYYLTDAMGSVIGITDDAGNIVGSVKYDAFGREFDAQGDMSLPASAGGDFHFHGQWKEAATGLYDLRARDYDPETGRFLSADPAQPDYREPESLNRYMYANSNPYLFADPSGRFTLISVNISINIQATLRTIAVQIAKDYLIDKARSVIGSVVLSAVKNFTALNSFNPWGFVDVNNAAQAGRVWEQKIQNFICSIVPDVMREIVWFEPHIRGGYASGNGYGCPGGGGGISPRRSAKPDFMLSKTEPEDLGKRNHKSIKAYLIGETKLSLKTFYNAYVKNGGYNRNQFNQIIRFAEDRVYARTAVFLALYSGSNNPQVQTGLSTLLARKAFRKGVIAIMVSAF